MTTTADRLLGSQRDALSRFERRVIEMSATYVPPTATQEGFHVYTVGPKDLGLVYCRIDGYAPPAPRPRATLVPTGNWHELVARARRAGAMKDLAGLFRAQIYSAPRDHAVTIWKREAKPRLLAAREFYGFSGPLVAKAQPLEVMILRVRALAKTHHRKTRTIPRSWDTGSTGDWENIAKPICDVANGILWHDDCQITRGTVETIVGAQGEPDRLELIARPLRDIPERTRFEVEIHGLGLREGRQDGQHGDTDREG